MHVKEIIQVALQEKMVDTRGKALHITLNADLYVENNRKAKQNVQSRFVKVARSTWGLKEWE